MKKASNPWLLKARALLLIILVTVFFFLFFLQVVEQYCEKYTNIAKFEERVESVEAPTITICSGWKKSLMDQYKITNMVFQMDPGNKSNNTMNVRNLFDEVTHELNKDFSISVSNNLSHPIPLNVGVNTIKEQGGLVQNYTVKENLSTRYGKCYIIIRIQLQMKPLEDLWSVTIAKNITSGNKDLDKISIQISANDTFNSLYFKMNGVKNDISEQIFTQQTNGYIEIEYTEKNMEFTKECSDDGFFRCFAKRIIETSEFNCSKKCIPIYAQSVMEDIDHDIPQCAKNDEEYCMIGLNSYKKWMKLKSACQKQCKNKAAILDFDRISSEPIYHIGDVQLELYLQVTATKVRYKEYLIYDGIGMFGSIGGSLGLFVGFSLFDSLSLVLEYVFKKFSSQ